MMPSTVQIRKGLIGVILVGMLGSLPFLTTGYTINFLLIIFYWIGLSGCWNFMSGYTGYIDFGSAAYVGVGSYVAGILILKSGLGIIPAVLIAGLSTLALALIIGWPTLKLKGAYFAIATFALAETLKQVTEEWNSLTGGGSGLTYPVRLDDLTYYWIYLGLAGLVIGMTYLTDGSKVGYAAKAICQDEQTAARFGINTRWIKVRTYGQSAFFMGLLGALEASRIGYITPVDVFNVHITIKMIIMSLLGGMGTVLGPVIGAGFLQIVEETLGTTFLNWYLVFMGILIVLVIMFMPRGINGWVKHKMIRGLRKP
jgi:branched-chain amino acid transport system permease protein